MNKIQPAIVEGIIAVANHKLRLESIESYKEYISKKFYSEEQVNEIIERELNAAGVITGEAAKKILDDVENKTISKKQQKFLDECVEMFKDKLPDEEINNLTSELEHFEKTKKPRCPKCKKDYKQLDEYTWEPVCDCLSKNFKLSVG